MKKGLRFVCLLAVIAVVSLASTFVSYAETNIEEECDVVFFETLNEMVANEGIVTQNNTVRKEPVYDIDLNQLGYIYYMYFEETSGYAFVINTSGKFEVAELYFDAEDPYAGYDGDKVYVNLMLYAVWDGENLIETQYGLILDRADETLEQNALYADDYDMSLGDETVYYTNRIENEYALSKRYPEYIPMEITNGCTPAAGGNIIGYYTRFFPELMPGFTPGITVPNTDLYFYDTMPKESIELIKTLYNYMGTNTEGAGTSIDGFKSGMKKFCNEKNRNISFTSCMKGSSFDFEKAKQKFQSGQPSVVFVGSFMVCVLMDDDLNEAICYLKANANHAMAGFGYSEITYTLQDGSTREDKYIMVATGLLNQPGGYFNINYNAKIDEYYSIEIY